MPIPAPSGDNKLLRFGLFEVNLSAGELRKNGARVRLQEQPFQVLTVLLNNAGRVVTREDLRVKIWPSDTFVDFDHSLNTAVNKIREALGDSASSPDTWKRWRAADTASWRRLKARIPVQRMPGPNLWLLSSTARRCILSSMSRYRTGV